MWDDVTYSLPNFNGEAVEFKESDKWCHTTFYLDRDYLPKLGFPFTGVSKKKGPRSWCII